MNSNLKSWKNSSNRRGNVDVCTAPCSVLGSNISRKPLYTPLDVIDTDYREDLGASGMSPYTRGIHASMYRGRGFTIRQLCGFGGPEETNERIKFLLGHGATGINVVFDIPTIQGYDSDNPEALGQVGMTGVAIDSVEDMETLFEGIPIDEISVSVVSHYPTNTAILLSMYLVVAERREVPFDKLSGSVQNDFIMEEVVRGALEFIPPDDCFRIQCDNIEFIRNALPQWNCVTFNGYNLREAGTSAVTETSVAMANAIETLDALAERGYDVSWVAERFSFFWDISNDFFEEVARLRAARRLWFRIMKDRFDTESGKGVLMRCHAQTSGLCLTREEPLNNIARSSYHALAAIFGGVQSLHVDSYDEAYSVPSEEASLVSLRTQQIIQEETGITQVADPLGGSFYVEALTNEIEKRVLAGISKIEEMGGIVAVVANGWLHDKIAKYACYENKMIEEGKIKIVGHNRADATSANATQDIQTFEPPAYIADRQHKKLEALRQRRNQKAVEDSLEALGEAAKRKENIIPYCIEAVKANVTIGEISSVIRKALGLWKPPLVR